MTTTNTPAILLNNGVRVPQLGLGVYQVPPAETRRVVEDALEAGYRHIDTATLYRNEASVGAAIAASAIDRGEIFITTKLPNWAHGAPLEAFEASREALGVEVTDLYLIHWPVPSRGLYTGVWHVLEELYDAGAVRAIGVSNFLTVHLDTLLAESTVVPAVNQIELHPTFQQAAVVSSCRARGIAIEAYSPLGQGADLDGEVVAALAAAHGATPAQIILAWHLAGGNIVIPKSVNPQRLRENFAALQLGLTPTELADIAALEAGFRIGGDPETEE